MEFPLKPIVKLFQGTEVLSYNCECFPSKVLPYMVCLVVSVPCNRKCVNLSNCLCYILYPFKQGDEVVSLVALKVVLCNAKYVTISCNDTK